MELPSFHVFDIPYLDFFHIDILSICIYVQFLLARDLQCVLRKGSSYSFLVGHIYIIQCKQIYTNQCKRIYAKKK